MSLELFLYTYTKPKILDKKINLNKYFLNEIGSEVFMVDGIDLRQLKKRIPICYDIKNALETNGYDSFKYIKEKIPFDIQVHYNKEIYEIKNMKLKEPSLINMFIEFITNIFTYL